MAKAKKPQLECVIPPAIDVMALPDMVFGQPPHEEQRVRGYMAWQCGDEKILYLERVGGEALMGRKMGFWDVTTDRGKWWVITNPTNLPVTYDAMGPFRDHARHLLERLQAGICTSRRRRQALGGRARQPAAAHGRCAALPTSGRHSARGRGRGGVPRSAGLRAERGTDGSSLEPPGRR